MIALLAFQNLNRCYTAQERWLVIIGNGIILLISFAVIARMLWASHKLAKLYRRQQRELERQVFHND